MAPQVFDGIEEQDNVVLEAAEAVVAVTTQKPTDFPGGMVMVNRKPFLLGLGSINYPAANSALAALPVEKNSVIGRGQTKFIQDHAELCMFLVGVVPFPGNFHITELAPIVQSTLVGEVLTRFNLLAKSADPLVRRARRSVGAFQKMWLEFSDNALPSAKRAGDVDPWAAFVGSLRALLKVLGKFVGAEWFLAVFAVSYNFMSSHGYNFTTSFSKNQSVNGEA
jgi:hypothetical protein